jgi:Leucine-rich repeat (LRR) protein
VHVTSISMRANNISGEIISALSELHYLKSLFLNDNHITSLSSNIDYYNLPYLRKFFMANNLLNMSLPSLFRDLNALEELHLENNLLYSIPSDAFANTTCCYGVDLDVCTDSCNKRLLITRFDGNLLRGTVSPSLAKLPSLQVLGLSNNYLTSFGEFILSSSLTSANFENNLISDDLSFLDENGFFTTHDLASLKSLSLSNNQLTGTIPNAIAGLSGVENLKISGNDLFGSIPIAFASLTNLRIAMLNDNLFSFRVTDNLNNLKFLTELDLSNNQIEALPDDFDGMDVLRILNLRNNLLTEIPDLEQLVSLEELDLSLNNIEQLPQSIVALSNLVILDVSNNSLTDAANLPEFTVLDKLILLDLHSNKLSGTLNDVFGLLSLRVLDLSDNLIRGTVPHSITTSFRLSRFNISNNRLQALPDSWVGLPLLQIFDASNNHLGGTVPQTLGYLRSLQILCLQGNTFVGDIPSTFGLLEDVLSIDLSLNALSGTIPTEIGASMSSLTLLNIQNNRLVGSLPSEILEIPNIDILLLGGTGSGNQLSGFLPDKICDVSTLMSWFDMDGSGLYWCPFPCHSAPLTESIECLNCPGSDSLRCTGEKCHRIYFLIACPTNFSIFYWGVFFLKFFLTCTGRDELCETCSYHGDCSFGNILTPASAGTCVGFTELFNGTTLEFLKCPDGCSSSNGDCTNVETALQCPNCDPTADFCQFDISNRFYYSSNGTLTHPALSTGDYSRAVSNYSQNQVPDIFGKYDPHSDPSKPACVYGVPPAGTCYSKSNSGVWTPLASASSCWHVNMLLAVCDCDEGFAGKICQTSVQKGESAINGV